MFRTETHRQGSLDHFVFFSTIQYETNPKKLINDSLRKTDNNPGPLPVQNQQSCLISQLYD
ncbi:hypothetical protein ACFQ49_18025 [Kroppenstedtia eburnea]|uniref:hypothetical protein n=1 Tax=Kroppenstedtia eburnea TaxID=714067 RepID=UPI00117AA73F|nr:hypothetical protein [Kroppenstedtia eburnea]QKI82142.1 hypothetical protein GXN75_09080 [Kroppenstedtia eburnea]